jgi:hypothetical protein
VNRLRNTVTCSRAAEEAGEDAFGNAVGEDRDAVEFVAAFFPPGTMAGSQIIDGALRQATITKPSLYVEFLEDNADATTPGAIRSGDDLTVDGEPGWQVDGDPARWINAQSGKHHFVVIELRRTVG